MTDRDASEKRATPPAPELWLGYADLLVPFANISALLAYQAAWDRRIARDYGQIPADVRAVVLLKDGRVLPARRDLADLHQRWIDWQRAHASGADGDLINAAHDETEP